MRRGRETHTRITVPFKTNTHTHTHIETENKTRKKEGGRFQNRGPQVTAVWLFQVCNPMKAFFQMQCVFSSSIF